MLVETDGRLVPIKHLPFKSLGAGFDGPSSHRVKQRFSNATTTPGLGHNQILQMPSTALPGAVSWMMKSHAHNAFLVRFRKGDFKAALICVLHKLVKGQRHLLWRVFIHGQFNNQIPNRMQVL